VPFPQTLVFVIVSVSKTLLLESIARSVSVLSPTMRTSVCWNVAKLQYGPKPLPVGPPGHVCESQ
jgi:hypothetical protein